MPLFLLCATIDHAVAKKISKHAAFDWANWLPACMACNHAKGHKNIVVPLHEDPRESLRFDISTGVPVVNPSASQAGKEKARLTIEKLGIDQQTYNDARRRKRQKIVMRMMDFIDGECDEARLLGELSIDEPHRAIVRDLILESDTSLNNYASIVKATIKKIPALLDWANNPA